MAVASALLPLSACGTTGPRSYVISGGAVTLTAPARYERRAGQEGIVLVSGKRRLSLAKNPAARAANLDDAACRRYLDALSEVTGKRVELGGERYCRGWKRTDAGGVVLTVLADGKEPWVLRCAFVAGDAIGAQAECDAIVAKVQRSPAAHAPKPASIAAKARPKTGASAGETTRPEVTIQIFMMSKCRHGNRALSNALLALDTLGPKAALKLDYIVNKYDGRRCYKNKRPHRGFCALHGPSEIKGNMAQLCAGKLSTHGAAWRRFLTCSQKSWQTTPHNWQRCAKEAGLGEKLMRRCIDGAEGRRLLAASMARAKAVKATGSPTITINGSRHRGPRGAEDLLRAACKVHDGFAICSKLPEPPLVQAIVLNDKRCRKCDTTGLEKNLRSRFFPRLTVERVDYKSAKGQKLYNQLGLEKLPVWLFLPSVKRAPKYARLRLWLRPVGNYLKLRTPAQWNPTHEVCDNKIDDTGNGKVDCLDPTCKGKQICRKEKRRHIDLFVMSRCPFAAKALRAYEALLPEFGRRRPRLRLHYIVDKSKNGKCRRGPPHRGFCALHGVDAVKENIRQLCAWQLYKRRDRYLRYVFCRVKNFRSDNWRSCATKRISAKRIERCAKSPLGVKLLEKSMQHAKTLSITGSPTWLFNNRYKGHGISAAKIRTLYCKRNPKEKLCKKAGLDAASKGSSTASGR